MVKNWIPRGEKQTIDFAKEGSQWKCAGEAAGGLDSEGVKAS